MKTSSIRKLLEIELLMCPSKQRPVSILWVKVPLDHPQVNILPSLLSWCYIAAKMCIVYEP